MSRVFQSCNILADLRNRGELCDAVIRVKTDEFPVHRNIMAACSAYFRTLFATQQNQGPGAKEVNSNDILLYSLRI